MHALWKDLHRSIRHPIIRAPILRSSLLRAKSQKRVIRDPLNDPSLKSTRKIGFSQLAVLGVSIALTIPPALALVFNYQRQNSPLLTSLMLSLRTSPVVQQELGADIKLLNGRFTWIHGELNSIKGKADAGFWIKGSKDSDKKAWVELSCRRDKSGAWKTTKYRITVCEGKNPVMCMDLLQLDGGVGWELHSFNVQ